MKILLLISIITSILFVPFILEESWQTSENLFYGTSSFEKLPSTISYEPSTFELKIRYTEGPYLMIQKLTPVFDLSPKNAKPYVQIDAKSMDGLLRNDVGRIKGTITIDPKIPYKKLFISVYFNGTDGYGNTYKSAWTDSVTLSVEQGGTVDVSQKCKETALGAAYGKPIDLEYDIDGGTVISICKLEYTNSVITKIDAESEGQITITIPKKTVYSLASTDCKYSDLMILMNNEETLPTKSIHSKKDNTITVEFSKGVHTIEFIGFTILPSPAPSQYCGVVMGFDSLYLPPKYQIERGMEVKWIRCNEGLELVIKSSDGNPVCVKPQTKQKLVQRGLVDPSPNHGTGVIQFDSNSKSNSTNNGKNLENTIPPDFSIVYSFGIDGKNIFDSTQNRFLADMVCDPPIEISMRLSDTEKQAIWQSALKNNFFSFDNFTQNCDDSGQCLEISPEEFTTLSITGNGKMHAVQHRGSYLYNDNRDYLKFEEITEVINSMLRSRDDFKNIPSPRCAYE